MIDLTISEIRDQLISQLNDIQQHLSALEAVEQHLNPISRVEVVNLGSVSDAADVMEVDLRKGISPSVMYAIDRTVRIPATKAGRKYEKGHEITDGEFVVGYIGRRRQGSWDAMSADYQQLGHAATKSAVLAIVAANQ